MINTIKPKQPNPVKQFQIWLQSFLLSMMGFYVSNFVTITWIENRSTYPITFFNAPFIYYISVMCVLTCLGIGAYSMLKLVNIAKDEIKK